MPFDQFDRRLARIEAMHDGHTTLIQNMIATLARLEGRMEETYHQQQEIISELSRIDGMVVAAGELRVECFKACSKKMDEIDSEHQARLNEIEPMTKTLKFLAIALTTVLAGLGGTWLAHKMGLD